MATLLQTQCSSAPRPQRRLELPWQPLLTPEEQRRGISYYGSGRALHGVAAKLLAGQPIKAYALGGSITGGGGSTTGQRAYVPRFFEFIRHNFPHRWEYGPAGSQAVLICLCPFRCLCRRALAASGSMRYLPPLLPRPQRPRAGEQGHRCLHGLHVCGLPAAPRARGGPGACACFR